MSLDDNVLIEGFFRNELSEDQKTAFHEKMKESSEFREKVFLERQLFENMDPESWSFLETSNHKLIQEYKELFESDEINDLKQKLETSRSNFNSSKGTGSRKWYLYVSAAVIALFVSVFAWLNGNSSSENLYDSYLNLSELPSLVERSGSDSNVLVDAQRLFETNEYEASLALLNSALQESTLR